MWWCLQTIAWNGKAPQLLMIVNDVNVCFFFPLLMWLAISLALMEEKSKITFAVVFSANRPTYYPPRTEKDAKKVKKGKKSKKDAADWLFHLTSQSEYRTLLSQDITYHNFNIGNCHNLSLPLWTMYSAATREVEIDWAAWSKIPSHGYAAVRNAPVSRVSFSCSI